MSPRDALRTRLRHSTDRFRHFVHPILVEEGASLVEFALVAVLCFTVLFGVMMVGFAFYSHNVIAEAAREGSRYAIVRGSQSCAESTPGCDATASSIRDYVRGLGFPGINPDNLTVTTTWSPTTAGTTCTPSALCNNPGNQVRVQVQYAFPLDIPFVPSQMLNLTSTSQMVISQ